MSPRFVFCYKFTATVKRFVYDLLLPKGDGSVSFQLKPLDGEVEKFEVCMVIGLAPVPIHVFFYSFFPLTRWWNG